jgi:hypothetical protein
MAIMTGQAYYKHELKKLIAQEIERLRDIVTVNFTAIDDFAKYRHHIGVIEGLRKALELCEDAESIVNGAERG